MTSYSSVFQRVRRQIELEHPTADNCLSVVRCAAKMKGFSNGELTWIAPLDVRPYNGKSPFRLSHGEKHPLTAEETKTLALVDYKGNLCEYVYEGQLKRRSKKTNDQKDPRFARRHGNGTLFYPNGTVYEGNWYNNKRHGVGCITSSKGYTYAGNWLEDVPNGSGYEMFTSQAAIDAHYVNGKPHGDGTIMYNPKVNAYRYEGQWRDGRRHGKGVIFYPNGDTFECTFLYGRRYGRGVTTQTRNGRLIQYETTWRDDNLVDGPKVISKGCCTKKPVSSIPYRMKGYLKTADILNWTVTEKTSVLSYDNFIQLKLGFELLDVVGCGFLPFKYLSAVWPEKNIEMLRKLESVGKDCLELIDILGAWYPNVSAHDIVRLMQEFISPFDLLRLRGFLNGIEDAEGSGYYHLCGRSTEQLTEKSVEQRGKTSREMYLHISELEANEYRIGGEEFTAADYIAAAKLHNPPHFVDLLEVRYPNVLRFALEHYEMEEIDAAIVNAIWGDFNRYAHFDEKFGKYLLIDDFIQAEADYQKQLYSMRQGDGLKCGDNSSTPLSPPPVFSSAENNSIAADMREGFFKGTAMWVLGNRIRLNIPLLAGIENFYVRQKGCVTFDELLRFCFPNVPCLRTQEILLGQLSQTACGCKFCKMAK